MKFWVLLAVAFEVALGFPLPAGQIVKYRVPTKFFTQPGETAQEGGGSSSLYDFLSQIHYGGASGMLATNSVQSEDVSKTDSDAAVLGAFTDKSSNERPEASDDDDVTTEQLDLVKVDDDNGASSLQALIEKVVNDEIKKLAQEIVSSEVMKASSNEAAVESTTTVDESLIEQQTELSVTTESVDPDSETVLPTNAPAVESETIKLGTIFDDTTETLHSSQPATKVVDDAETTTTNSLQADENVIEENSISDSLLSAVGDLLSSILGLDGTAKEKVELNAGGGDNGERIENVDNESTDSIAVLKAKEPESFTTTEASSSVEIEQGTEKMDESATPVGYEGEEESAESETVPTEATTIHSTTRLQSVSEIDLKIENLANGQTSLTESTPEMFVENIVDGFDFDPNMLEVISDPSSDTIKPISIDESVSQVMSLMKGESRPDTILIDKNMANMASDVSDLDDIVYGTLKELETSLGMHHEMPNDDIVSNNNLIKNLAAEITDPLTQKNPFDFDNFVVPNSAKAALLYKHDDDDDDDF